MMNLASAAKALKAISEDERRSDAWSTHQQKKGELFSKIQEVGRRNLHGLHDGRDGVASEEARRDHGRGAGFAHHSRHIKR